MPPNPTRWTLKKKTTNALNIVPRYSRSTADHDAAHSIGETVGKQAGDVVVHDLHLATLELSDLIQADLVLLRVLEEGGGKKKRGKHLKWGETEDEEKAASESILLTRGLPCGQAWRTAGSRSSGSCSRSPSGGTRPSPGWTSRHRGSSAHSPRSWGGEEGD